MNNQNKKQDIDVINQHTGEKWYYTDIVKDHFFHPRNLLWERPKNESEFDAHGMVGSPACGDMMEMWLKADSKTERVVELKWKTFGCASAIAATSIYSVMLTENGGMTLEVALKVKPQDVMKRLGGLPNRKIYYSVRLFCKFSECGFIVLQPSTIVHSVTSASNINVSQILVKEN